MRHLHIRKLKPAKKVRIHQTLIQRSRRVPAVEKALFHQELGAGRSHVLRRFFGMSESDQTVITERVALFLDQATA